MSYLLGLVINKLFIYKAIIISIIILINILKLASRAINLRILIRLVKILYYI